MSNPLPNPRPTRLCHLVAKHAVASRSMAPNVGVRGVRHFAVSIAARMPAALAASGVLGKSRTTCL